MTTDLSDLVNNPRETLEIELKQWLDLTDGVSRANIARHLAALCNHGGGYLVFGFRDDLSIDPSRPESLQDYNRDTFSAIATRYLTPAFHCDVAIVQSSGGLDFPIVHVPSHGAVPVCAVRDGPHDQGRPQGIRMGTYYVRAPGPKSVPISSPEQWSALIRRCTLNDRDALLRDFGLVLRPDTPPERSRAARLAEWAQAVNDRFIEALAAAQGFQWPNSLADNHYQLSYSIAHQEPPLRPNGLRSALEEINNEVRDTVWTGWSMFYPFARAQIAPAILPENPDGTGADVLEANLILGRRFETTMPDFWRVSSDGRASLIRGYREDVRLEAPGRWLSPVTVLRETTELVRHARAFARRFPSASTISFRCHWKGLRGREIRDIDPSVYWSPGRTANARERTTLGEWSVAQLSADWPGIVADLGCPILSLFGLDFCSADFVRGLAPRFITLR